MKRPLSDRLFMAAIFFWFLWCFFGGLAALLIPAVKPVYVYGVVVIVGVGWACLIGVILVYFMREIFGRDV